MKNTLTTILLIVTCNCFSQNHIISEYEKYDYQKKYSNYYSLLNENENLFVLKVDDYKFIVFKSDMTIYKINVGYLSGGVVRKQKIEDAKLIQYKAVLDSLNKINASVLNITTRKDGNSIIIQDADTWGLQLFKGNYVVDYSSYAPYECIEFKVDYYQERIKFLNAYKKAHELFDNKDDQEYENIKKSDTLYLKINKTDSLRLKKLKIEKSSHNFTNFYSLKSVTNHTIVVKTKYDNKDISSGGILTMNSKKFVSKNKDKIIELDFLDQYGLDLLLNQNKIIYVIDDNDYKKKKMTLQRAIFR
jgi:hypothetical protein